MRRESPRTAAAAAAAAAAVLPWKMGRRWHGALTRDVIVAILPRLKRRYRTDTHNVMMVIATYFDDLALP